LEVFRMSGQGKGVRHIAEQLEVTVAKVNSPRNRIKDKIGLKRSTEVMLHASGWSGESTSP
jgi:DNA-binding CsgD family transcriptional regulator